MVSCWYGDKKTKTPSLNASKKAKEWQISGPRPGHTTIELELCRSSHIFQYIKRYPIKFHYDQCWSSHFVLPSMLGTFDLPEGQVGQAPAMLTACNWMCKYDLPMTPQPVLKLVQAPDWLEVGKHISRGQKYFVPLCKVSEWKTGTPSKNFVFTITSNDSRQTLTN